MAEKMEELHDVIKRLADVRTAMVTTPDERGTLSARPLTKQMIDPEGDVWFLVDRKADWVTPANTGPMNVSIVDGEDAWVSFAGRAEVVDNAARIEQLRDPISDAFFTKDSEIVALRCVTDRIEWWASNGTLTTLLQVAKAKVTRGTPNVGSSGTIEV